MPKHHTRRATTLALAVTLTALGGLQPGHATDIAVEQPWARAAQQGGVGGAFMRIENHGTAPDRLISASSSAARSVEFHTTIRAGDVMRMRPVNIVEVPARGTVQLQPGGLHIMLIGLQYPLARGDEVPLTLVFERAGQMPVRLQVQGAGAKGAMQGNGAPSSAPQR
jgi:copper(I)-binding protein